MGGTSGCGDWCQVCLRFAGKHDPLIPTMEMSLENFQCQRVEVDEAVAFFGLYWSDLAFINAAANPDGLVCEIDIFAVQADTFVDPHPREYEDDHQHSVHALAVADDLFQLR